MLHVLLHTHSYTKDGYTKEGYTKDLKNLKTVNFGGWVLARDNMVVGT